MKKIFKIEMVLVEGNASIKSFYLGKYQVRQKQFLEIMQQSRPVFSKGSAKVIKPASRGEALRFCNILSKSNGFRPAYDESSGELLDNEGYRLPTAEEWEFAALGGNQAKGYLYSGVSQAEGNEAGISDIRGNVWELVHEQFPSGKFQAPRSDGYGDIDSREHVVYRYDFEPATCKDCMGFRLARSLPLP